VISPEVIARVSAPASVANFGVGFDVHSIALEQPQIHLQLESAPRNVRKIRVKGRYANDTTTDPNLNASGQALDTFYEEFGKSHGYLLTIQVNTPPRAGLGLSGAEAVGAVLCAAVGLDIDLSREEVAQIAARVEPMQHMDNVAACALGGFNIVARNPVNGKTRITTIPPPTDLGVAIVVPSIIKPSTMATRQLLPDSASREKYVESIGYASTVTAALANHDLDTLLETIPWDPFVEPARAAAGAYGNGVTPEFLQSVKREMFDKFHVAETVSGAGPSHALWYSLSEDQKTRRKNGVGLIKPAVELITTQLGTLGHSVKEVFITKPSTKGATIHYSPKDQLDRR
jgi:homoserine kinase